MTSNDMSGRFCPQDIFKYRSIQAINCVKGADVVICEVSVPDADQDANVTTIWLIPLEDGAPEQFTSGDGGDGGAAWSPDPATFAFTTSRTGSVQVHLIQRSGGESRPLTDMDSMPLSVTWSPDGKTLLATAKVAVNPEDRGERGPPARGEEPQVVWRLPYKMDGLGYTLDAEIHLFLIDAATGEARQITDGPFDVRAKTYSPDGGRIAFVRTRTGREAHLTDLWVMNADGSDPRQITHDIASVSAPAWSPEGGLIAFSGSEEEGASRQRLWIANLATDAIEPLGEEAIEVESGSSLFWSEDSTRVVFIVIRQGLQEVAAVTVSDGRCDTLVTGERHVTQLAVLPDRLVYAAASSTAPVELYSCDWSGGSERRLSDLNGWWTNKAPPRTTLRRFEVPDGDGGTEQIDGWLMLPPGEGDGPFPLLVDVHGGPHAVAFLEFTKHPYRHVICAKGWAVLALNPVGSSSYGKAFAERLRGRWGDLDLEQQVTAINQLRDEGVVDDRLAITGKSYGGFQAAWAITQTDMFRSAVISAPVSNIESHFGTSDSGYYVTPYSMYGEPFINPEATRKLSPLVHMHQARTPTLLLQGLEDQRCPVGQAEEIFATLMRSSDIPVEMILYPGGDHHMLEEGQPSFRVDYITRLVDWVTRWTDHASTPADSDDDKGRDRKSDR